MDVLPALAAEVAKGTTGANATPAAGDDGAARGVPAPGLLALLAVAAWAASRRGPA